MWRKFVGLALLAFVAFALSGCAAHYRAHGYRDGYAPGYVQVRVGTGYRRGAFVPGPAYRARHDRHSRRHDQRHCRGCGHDRR
jgi:hypothetical protein